MNKACRKKKIFSQGHRGEGGSSSGRLLLPHPPLCPVLCAQTVTPVVAPQGKMSKRSKSWFVSIIKEARSYSAIISSCDLICYSLWPHCFDFCTAAVQGYIELFEPLTLWNLCMLFPSSVVHFESASCHTRTVCYRYVQQNAVIPWCYRDVSVLSF